MSKDLVALLRAMPDVRAVVGGMVTAGRDLRVRQAAGGAVIQLCDAGGRPLVSIEVPVLVQVPGEVERLLGPEMAAEVEPPLWWVEVRATERDGADRIARDFAADLVGRLGGVMWAGERPPDPDPAPPAGDVPPPQVPRRPGGERGRISPEEPHDSAG